MPKVVRTEQCLGGCGCYTEIDEDGRRYHYIGGYIANRLRAGDLPEYMKPDWIPPGMGGLPKRHPDASSSVEYEPSIVVALRREGRREEERLKKNTDGDGV
jgi:hypothetical protein